jgi:hypothetical protein
VGSFPAGDAPGGVHDLAGNVREMVVPLERPIVREPLPAPGHWSAGAEAHGTNWMDRFEESGRPLLGPRAAAVEAGHAAFGFRCARSLR